MGFRSLLTLLIDQQRQQAMIEDDIRRADTSRLEPGLSETDLIQQLVSALSDKPTQQALNIPSLRSSNFCSTTATSRRRAPLPRSCIPRSWRCASTHGSKFATSACATTRTPATASASGAPCSRATWTTP